MKSNAKEVIMMIVFEKKHATILIGFVLLTCCKWMSLEQDGERG